MELKEIGDILKKARLAQGLQIQDIERDTKIRSKFIIALEEGDDANLPGDVSARGFLKNYAEYLSIDPLEMLEAFRTTKPMERDEYRFTKREAAVFNTNPPKTNLRWKSLVFILLGLVFVAMLGYYFKDFLFKPSSPSEENEVAAADQYATSPIAGTTGEVAGSDQVQERNNQIKFIVSGQRCYVDIKVDGADIYRGMFERGEEKEFTYQQSVSIRTNDAGSITVIANGASLGALGPQGELVTREFRLE